jgi:regulator of protease activity HflC (stomatin/prohibitin superfamily)
VTLGELLAQLIGWLGDFVQFLIGFVPHLIIVRVNERGVLYPGGGDARELLPGLHWYFPWRSKVVTHEVTRFTLPIDPIPLETEDGIMVEVGLVVTYRVSDIVMYEVDNFIADDNIRETAEGELCSIVKTNKWSDLCAPSDEGSRLEKKLRGRMAKALEKFGVDVEGCRPNAQVRLSAATHMFGVHQRIEVDGKSHPD